MRISIGGVARIVLRRGDDAWFALRYPGRRIASIDVVGVIGNVANTLLAMKQEKQNHDYQLALIPLQLNADLERNKSEVAKTVEVGAAAAFVASQEADKLDGRESPWAANLKAMVRPSILLLLLVGIVALADPPADAPTVERPERV